jgi:SAM-dependent methyltransferase
MTPRRPLPETASVAHPVSGARLSAPAAERNASAITQALQDIAPPSGRALEIASGTGQHVIAFARALPGLIWQPSEIDAARRASIDAYAGDAALSNLRPAIALDATAKGWGVTHGDQNLIVLINLLHLISAPEAQTLIRETAHALAPSGRFALYGPFLREGKATSEGDARFDASLRAQDPEIGYKDLAEVTKWFCAAGLDPVKTLEMPANNILLVTERPA